MTCCEERTDDEHEQSSMCAERTWPLLERFSCSSQEPVAGVFRSTLNRFFRTRLIWEPIDLMILRMRDSADSVCLLWLTQHVWTKLLDNWFCANAMARVNRGPEWFLPDDNGIYSGIERECKINVYLWATAVKSLVCEVCFLNQFIEMNFPKEPVRAKEPDFPSLIA